jgi:hypothetical protein
MNSVNFIKRQCVLPKSDIVTTIKMNIGGCNCSYSRYVGVHIANADPQVGYMLSYK